ncbi:hypothetical protein F0562_015176 [Nyssa sinensis]|uniref:Uncharacterized protein n=1 Tax=Nyssa sinensis TaxID=561372 RepID=A0A5J4ZJM9_9ASTE|nr:hypothetical protein F0562_015176 [Nyssa sinensis]
MAEARREIVDALQLHRSSSSSSSCKTWWGHTIVGHVCNCDSIRNPSDSIISCLQYCSSLSNNLPLGPEPTWSTTAPSIPATPPPPMEALEFEWAENLASSYTWWLGFLDTLDVKNTELSNNPSEENIIGEGNSRLFGQCPDHGSKLDDIVLSLDANDQSSSNLDEWLTFPTSEDQGELIMMEDAKCITSTMEEKGWLVLGWKSKPIVAASCWKC